jgi:hypothetical protein
MVSITMNYHDRENIYIHNLPKEEFEKWKEIGKVNNLGGDYWAELKIGRVIITLFQEK